MNKSKERVSGGNSGLEIGLVTVLLLMPIVAYRRVFSVPPLSYHWPNRDLTTPQVTRTGFPPAVAIITILILTSQTGQCVGRVATVADIPLMLAVLSNLN